MSSHSSIELEADFAKKSKAANMWIPFINDVVKKKRLKQVTSLFIKEPSTNKFHSEGLFSEEIFGQLASPSRMTTFGYIDLKTDVLHPHIFTRYVEVNGLYDEIMSGKTQVAFDTEIKDFVKLSNIKVLDEKKHYIGTGYGFFLKYANQIQLKHNASLKRTFNIHLLEKYKNIQMIDKWIVAPAGIRDYNIEEDKQQMEEMNQLYSSILVTTLSLPSIKSEDPIWDSLRYNLQKKIVAIWDYFYNIIEGKSGFIQKKFAARSVAMGTRNVITGTKLSSYSSKGLRHNSNETMIPVFQAAKMFAPIVIYYMNIIFFGSLMDQGSESIHLIEPTSYNLVKVNIDSEEKKSILSKDSMMERIESFRSPDIRFKPFGIFKDKRFYYFYLVYDDIEEIHLFRNIQEFSIYYKELKGVDPDRKKIRPLSNIEFLYICTEFATKQKHTQTTRYPVLGARNTYMSKTVVMTTEPSRPVVFVNTLTGESNEQDPFFHYPVFGYECVDGMRIHSIWLKNIGGDHDGDTGNNIGLWSSESNKEVADYMNSKKFFLTPSGKLKLTISALSPVMDLTFKNMCHRTFNYS